MRVIEQGRATFRNVRRFLTYHLTDNVAELSPFALWALTGGRVLVDRALLTRSFGVLGATEAVLSLSAFAVVSTPPGSTGSPAPRPLRWGPWPLHSPAPTRQRGANDDERSLRCWFERS